jgi:hypothetical protein
MRMTGSVARVGQRVLVSDSGPRGWIGRVITASPGYLTVRRENGGRCIVDVTRRTVQVCSTSPIQFQRREADPATIASPVC